MVRIAGVTLPNKRIVIALTYLYGIGKSISEKLLTELKINLDTRANDLSEQQLTLIREKLQSHTVEGDLRRQKEQAIRRLKEIGCYRGQRHKRRLPARGQRTKTNARTRKGRKAIAIAKKKTT